MVREQVLKNRNFFEIGFRLMFPRISQKRNFKKSSKAYQLLKEKDTKVIVIKPQELVRINMQKVLLYLNSL